MLQKQIQVIRLRTSEGFEYGLFVNDEHRRSFVAGQPFEYAAVSIEGEYATFGSFTNSLSQFPDRELNDPNIFIIHITVQ